MYYGKINKTDIANGIGVRVSLFVSGCRNCCEGCFQPETWSFVYGKLFTDATLNEIIEALRPEYIDGLTILGGEPFEPENQETVSEIIKKVKEVYPKKDIWMYTGYTFDTDLKKGGVRYTAYTDTILNNIDVLVDGRFELSLKDPSLNFRGSSNQRIIDIKKSMQNKAVVHMSELE